MTKSLDESLSFFKDKILDLEIPIKLSIRPILKLSDNIKESSALANVVL